jgi:3-oxoacyl-[acyl-carrier protein] reductase
MAPRRRGTLVLVSSSRAFTGSAGRIAYAASKAGAAGLARALAVELAPSGLAVHVVCPGFQPSRLNRFDERMRAAEAGAALLGIEHSARDAAEFVAFLCEGRLRGVTGQTFHLHGKILPEVEP